MNAEEILDRLEAEMAELEEFSGATFEVLEDYWALADARLSVFASDRLWALAIEAVRYDTRSDEFNLDIWLYGNCLRPRADFMDLTRPLFRVPQAWNQPAAPDVWGYARDGFSILWRGRRFDFSPTAEEITAAQIRLSRREQQSGVLSPVQVLRFLCHHLGHPFFAGEDTLRALLDARRFDVHSGYVDEGEALREYFETELGRFDEYPILSCDLELVLQTREWRHPRYGEMPEETIAVREAFAPLAEALAAGDFTVWHNQDPARFNSHWSHWAETESAAEVLWEQNQILLAEEGRRFQDLVLAKLGPAEREEAVQSLREEWQRTQSELQALLSQPQTDSFTAVRYVSNGFIEHEGQTFTFGPHLWGETESADHPYPGTVSPPRPTARPEPTPPSHPEED